jgi:hypothetical protein
MKNNRTIIFGLLAGFILLVSIVIILNLNNKKQWPARYHLICEVLQPGMSKEEVLDYLSRAGKFTTRETEWGVDGIEVLIDYMDPNGKDLYGYFNLLFINNKYYSAYISAFDSHKSICEFPASTISGKPTNNS